MKVHARDKWNFQTITTMLIKMTLNLNFKNLIKHSIIAIVVQLSCCSAKTPNKHKHHRMPLLFSSQQLYLLSSLILLIQTVQSKPPPITGGANHGAENRMLLQDRAILHVNLMNTLGRCRDPKPQIIYPPTPGGSKANQKRYYPRGTILHRCSDQIGCCPNIGEVCRPESVHLVEKVFFVHHWALGQRLAGNGHRTSFRAPSRNFTATTTEVLTFTNHTSCACVKLAPDAIEHDELQSVVSRPVASRSIAAAAASSRGGGAKGAEIDYNILYHIIGGLASVIAAVAMFLLYKWCYYHRPPLLRRGP